MWKGSITNPRNKWDFTHLIYFDLYQRSCSLKLAVKSTWQAVWQLAVWLKESIWIRSRGNNTMNKDEGGYKLNRIFDQLITKRQPDSTRDDVTLQAKNSLSSRLHCQFEWTRSLIEIEIYKVSKSYLFLWICYRTYFTNYITTILINLYQTIMVNLFCTMSSLFPL